MARKPYILTLRAERDLREARAWSRARWGKPLTHRYFDDLHKAAQYVAQNHDALSERSELAGGTPLHIYPVREHYLIYEPLSGESVAIVAVIRQGRDIPTILQKWKGSIRRELADIRLRISRGEVALSSRAKSERRPARRKS